MDKSERVYVHEWDPGVLEPALRKAKMRLWIAVLVAAPTLIMGVAGLVLGGKAVIWGLAALAVSTFAAAFALRNKTKMDYCVGQLDKIARGEGPA